MLRRGVIVMGTSRDDDQNRLLPLSPRQEMADIAGGRSGEVAGHDAWLTFLKSNPQDARELGALAALAGRTMHEAYPGETRTTTFSNSDWREAGYAQVAEMNELLGLEGL